MACVHGGAGDRKITEQPAAAARQGRGHGTRSTRAAPACSRGGQKEGACPACSLPAGVACARNALDWDWDWAEQRKCEQSEMRADQQGGAGSGWVGALVQQLTSNGGKNWGRDEGSAAGGGRAPVQQQRRQPRAAAAAHGQGQVVGGCVGKCKQGGVPAGAACSWLGKRAQPASLPQQAL